ncbi:polymer-forming cytoskeletal protein [Halobaculum halobium]|uniref:Polymer-forming cytoskeletal protein n=1 Tax=Halobaculum halobium TaxID=3032281 RepID=A0ABD5TFJ2_9EURY|nr:polymer-forming cytoskeletal protein [Halobaculum sp. SYNS20]
MTSAATRSLAAVLVVFVLVTGASAPAAAAESQIGGTVVVAAGETISDDLDAVGGTVIVRGTVDGDVNAVGGTVVIAEPGVVTGDLTGSAGAVTVEGRVGGSVELATGSFTLRQSGEVGGDIDVAGGEVVLDGAVGGTATVAAETLRVGSTASIDGDLRHDVQTLANEGQVAGEVRAVDLGNTGFGGFGFTVPTWISVLYTVLAHLALGAVLLLVVPGFVREVETTGVTRAPASGGVGLATLVLAPILLVLLAITIVGIPLALLGAAAYGLLVWIGLVLGAYVLGRRGLRALDRDEGSAARWIALVVGVLLVGLSQFVPGGGLFRLALTVVGAGAVVLALNARRTGRRGDEPTEPEVGGTGDATA